MVTGSELSLMASLLSNDDSAEYMVTSYRIGDDRLLNEVATLTYAGQAVALAEAEAAARQHAVVIAFRETEDAIGIRRTTVLKVYGILPSASL